MILLETERLILRPFELSDAPVVEKLAGAYEVARTTLNIPHPYPEGLAETYINGAREAMERGDRYSFAIVCREDGQLMGSITLSPRQIHHTAETGYWLGVPYWGHGYATEAVRRVIRFAFEDLNLNRVYATVFAGNAASERVLEKAGMKHEGRLREHYLKWDKYLDVDHYGIVKSDFTP